MLRQKKLLLCAALMVGAIFVVKALAELWTLRILNEKGLVAQTVSAEVFGITVEQLTHPLGTISQLKIHWGSPIQVTIYGASLRVDEAFLDQNSPAPAPASLSAFQAPVPISVFAEDLTLRFKEHSTTLTGPVFPALELSNPSTTIRREQSSWIAEHQHSLSWNGLSGALKLSYNSSANPPLNATLSNSTLSHPLLKKATTMLPELNGDLQFDSATSAIVAQFTALDSRIRFNGALSTEGFNGEYELDAALQDLIAVTDVPEEQKAEIKGRITVRGELDAPTAPQRPPKWNGKMALRDLAIRGDLFPASKLRREGQLYKPIHAEQTRWIGPSSTEWVSYKNLGWLPAAAVYSEDSQFWEHEGVSVEGIQVGLDALSAGEQRPRGGSTITQQLAKNLFLSPERSLDRKLRELLYTLQLERDFTKQTILSFYLNAVELGPQLYGAKAAADAYFAKSPAGLLPEEAAYIATLLPAPTKGYEDAKRGNFHKRQVRFILQNMRDGKLISDAELRAALKRPLRVIVD